ncbi:hypothetical protein M408DRAFT_312791 [Serendipita vermifera MAFF 305830]|uniref:MARVEL domain-containing protein n=1 Tax=Serendipita vermifera MAFF 305830 TaxID=933852 RepID=A0A0C2XUU4_SERVB|nr:hypothetical protein M408DRAFT_312791 [Serendipita vermifera MAFF 305830]
MAGYHPFLFFLIAAVGAAELGLTAYLVHDYENRASGYPSDRYRSLIIFILFNASWTVLFGFAYLLFIVGGALHALASIASSAIWLIITAILWGVAAGLFRNERGGGMCDGEPVISRCRQVQTVEALAWTEMGLCILTLLAACFWVRRSRRSYTLT